MVVSSTDPALAFTQRLLRAYIDNTSLGFIRADRHLRVLEWSERAAEIFGWSADEVLGKTREEIGMVYETDHALVTDRLAALDGLAKTSNRGENRNRTKDGRVIYCRWFNTRFVTDDDDQFVALVDDVTDEVTARADAFTNEQRFRSVFANAADGMVLLASDGTITHVNEAAQRMYGAPASTMIGHTLTDFFSESNAWIARSSVSRVLLGETVTDATHARRADGTTFPVTFSLAPVRVGDRIVGVVGTARDMSAFVEATASLEASEERFRSLFDYSPDPMLALALDGTLMRANAAAGSAYGCEAADLLGRNVLELVAPSDERRGRAAFAGAAAGKASAVELAALRADGTVTPMLATLIPIVFRGTISGVHLLARDLTPMLRAKREIAAQHERVRELYLVGASANATAENQIAATIDAGCRLLGMTSGALYDAEADRNVATVGESIPRRLARLVLSSDGALALDALDGVPDVGEAAVAEHRFGSYIGTAIDITGTRYGSLCFAAEPEREEPFTDSDRDLVQLMGALIGSAIERGRSRARLKHLAYNDQLTALPNRAWFAERLRDELALAAECKTRVAVMFLDLDRFKDINDTLGHALGDRLLQMIGDRLSSVVGGHGLVARMGGDEFIVLIPNDPTQTRLNEMAQHIIEVIDQPLVVDGYEQFVTTSIGIAVFPADGEDADTLIKHADVAMYRAKERGRNTHQFFTPSLAATLRTRISQEKSLRKALEHNEFEVHYQPQFDLSNGRLVGFEALVRWQHPRLGLVPPDQFIPSAEMSGLIVALGDFVLETACREVRRWQALIPNLGLSVNLSARQFHQSALAAKIRGVLERTGFDPGQLELEITESVAMSDAALSVQILEELQGAGVRFALDDFGTGYSSLGYLRRFPLNCLKIDQSFVRDIMEEPDDATIVQTVIAMAHSLGLEVCAEGVETVEQLDFLRAQNCDRVQGFLFARPMAATDLGTFIQGRGIATAVG